MKISKYFFTSPPILDTLPTKDLALFRKHLILKKIKKGHELFAEGAHPKGAFILKRGKIKLFQDSPAGGEQIVYIYAEGEMFGYRPLLSNERHPASARALEECSVYFLTAESFMETLNISTALSNILLRNLSHEFTVLVNRIAAFSQKSVRERTALSLLILQEKYRQPGDGQVEIALSRSDLASFVGTTNETIARIITRFKKEKIIRLAGRRIIIINPEILSQLAD